MQSILEVRPGCHRSLGATARRHLWKCAALTAKEFIIHSQNIKIHPDQLLEWRTPNVRCYMKKHTSNFTQLNMEWTSQLWLPALKGQEWDSCIHVQTHPQKPEERFIQCKRSSMPPLLPAEWASIHPVLLGPYFYTDKVYSTVIILLFLLVVLAL